VSVDGSEFFRSEKIHCAGCRVTHHKDGTVSYSHQMLGAVIVHPDRREVIPLCPEPIVKQDGQSKNDCEHNAMLRLLPDMRREHPHLHMIVVADGLASKAPNIREMQAWGFHYILGAKPGDHAYLFGEIERRRASGAMTVVERTDPKTDRRQVCRFVAGVPLNESNLDLLVNFVDYAEIDPASGEKVLYFSWVTDLTVTRKNVWEIVRGGRARWKVENETFNTLKNQGYNAKHNYGHGPNLSTVFTYLMMLAFLVDQVQQLCCPLFQAALDKLGSRRSLWQKIRGKFDNFVLDSMQRILEAIVYGLVRTAPPIDYPPATASAPAIADSS
jgi:hypothetical protein